VVKLNVEDNLAPMRNQIVDLITPISKVIEFGCGKGPYDIDYVDK